MGNLNSKTVLTKAPLYFIVWLSSQLLKKCKFSCDLRGSGCREQKHHRHTCTSYPRGEMVILRLWLEIVLQQFITSFVINPHHEYVHGPNLGDLKTRHFHYCRIIFTWTNIIHEYSFVIKSLKWPQCNLLLFLNFELKVLHYSFEHVQ